MNPSYNVLIIGAGSIGAFYDTPDSESISTHAHAFKKHMGFNLIGFVDIDSPRSQKAAELWNASAFDSVEQAFEKNKIDVVCIAVPDELHYDLLKKISAFPVKLVFTEKPLTKTMEHANEIVKIYQEKNISVVINYRRCFVPEFEKLRIEIEKGRYGKFVCGSGYYGKGLLHNGSHLINLLLFLIGEIEFNRYLDRQNDFYNDDPSVSVIVYFGQNKPFTINVVDCNLFTIFELDLLFEKGRIRIIETGFKIEEYNIEVNRAFPGFEFLFKSKEYQSSLVKSLYYSADNIYQHLVKNEKLKCSIKDGYDTLKICFEIISEMNKNIN